ncbi:unnamed protein product [Adineta ricciae]|uniref:Uncharacterized protein n=1 Tax=Adineta ricciae TaxID=249248 RepID=A0A815HJS8_ADIRI|nr:unnamed protein product [Adineta ricciae]
MKSIVLGFFFQLYLLAQGTSPFLQQLQNVTIIHKPNSYIYHLCQTSHPIHAKRIRWHYESLDHTNQDILTHCKHLINSSDCFDFYYGSSLSLLIVKESNLFNGKYTCHIHVNSTYEINSTAWVDVKLPSSDVNEDEESTAVFNENDAIQLAKDYDVPFIIDDNDVTSFGKRTQINGIFHTTCRSIESSHPISFLWLQLKHTSKGIKTIRLLHDDGHRVRIRNTNSSSSLSIYSVGFFDQSDYVCIAFNILGRSYSSKRSLIVSERMVLPHIHDNLVNNSNFHVQHYEKISLNCTADGHPSPDVVWTRVSDSLPLVQGHLLASLQVASEMHGLTQYMCEAKNKHGLTRIFINVIVPDVHIQPVLNYDQLQSRSVLLNWYVPNERDDRFNHYIVYYRALNHFDIDIDEHDELIDMQNYQQIFIDPSQTNYNLTYRVTDLIPYTNYEFRLKAFTGAVPSNYSNPVFIKTRESLPEKVDKLHGYIWNRTSVVVHWSPASSTNGPDFYYILYYTINTSIPFEQWSTIRIHSRPFYILPISIPANVQLFIRVASVNAKGSTLSDFHMINHSLLNSYLISSTIDNFQCISDEPNQSISLKWSIDHRSHGLIKNYIVYYSDLTQTNDDCLRTHLVPIDTIKLVRHLSKDLFEYKFNTSLLKLNYNKYHILRFDLAIIDQDENQLAMTSSSIYSTFPRKSGKQSTRVPFLIDRFSGRN